MVDLNNYVFLLYLNLFGSSRAIKIEGPGVWSLDLPFPSVPTPKRHLKDIVSRYENSRGGGSSGYLVRLGFVCRLQRLESVFQQMQYAGFSAGFEERKNNAFFTRYCYIFHQGTPISSWTHPYKLFVL